MSSRGDDASRRVRFGSCKRNAREHTEGSLAAFPVRRRGVPEGGGQPVLPSGVREVALFSPVFTAEQRAALGAQGFVLP